jgi:hypothetical protein
VTAALLCLCARADIAARRAFNVPSTANGGRIEQVRTFVLSPEQ